jgi:hypothetical protein
MMCLQSALYVGIQEIIADEEQAAGMSSVSVSSTATQRSARASQSATFPFALASVGAAIREKVSVKLNVRRLGWGETRRGARRAVHGTDLDRRKRLK